MPRDWRTLGLISGLVARAVAPPSPGYSPRDHREDQEENEVNTLFRLSKKMQGALLTFVNSADFSVFSVPLW
jgi:hypothetical protein